MRFLHVSDTHVGHRSYHRVNEHGLNQREQDFFDAFARSVDAALAEGVAAVLHSGDVFDSVRPTNRAVTFVMDQVRRLGDADVPFVVIAGNHESPKLRETGSVLRFLDFLPNAHSVYKGGKEVVRIGDTAFHCVPHAANEAALHAQLATVEADPDARFNVLTLHAGVVGVAEFSSGEFNEQNVPTSLLPRDFDYVALGHYHRATEVQPNTRYAGSTERTSFKEEPEAKGCYVVDLAKGQRDGRDVHAHTRFVDLHARPMVTLPTFDCSGWADTQIAPELMKRVRDAELAERIVRLPVKRMPRHVYATLNHVDVRKLAEAALHFQVQYEFTDAAGSDVASDAAIGGLSDEFDGFFARVPVEGVDRERVRTTAVALLDEATRGEAPGAGS